jgi:hypothetical protein
VTRIWVVATLSLTFLAASLAAEAQPTGSVYRIGMLFSVGIPEFRPEYNRNDRAFAEGLREYGYVVGQHIVIEVRNARGH